MLHHPPLWKSTSRAQFPVTELKEWTRLATENMQSDNAHARDCSLNILGIRGKKIEHPENVFYSIND